MSASTLRKLIALPVLLVLGWIVLKYLLPILSPFLLAGLLALAAEPIVGFLNKRSRLPRPAATGIGVTITLVLFILAIMVLAAFLLRQLGSLAGIVPNLELTAQEGLGALEGWLLSVAQRTPQGIRPLMTQGVEGLFSNSNQLLGELTTRLLGLASAILGQLPDSVLGIGTWLLASFMLSAKLPNIKSWVASRLPESWHGRYLPMLKNLKHTVSGWLIAQCKLIGITFCVLCAGFLILQVTYAPLWAAVICLVDALPVLGTGMVLAPWSLICFLQGDSVRGIGLLAVWAVASLLRSVLEPRFVGKQLGLDPLLTLVSMYTGYRLWGFGGMILSPLAAVTVSGLFSGRNSREK